VEGEISTGSDFAAEGGCTCRAVRYRITSRPLVVHFSHCRWCQRETGSAFVPNAMIEADRVELLGGTSAFAGFYRRNELCPADSLARREALLG